MDAEKLKQAVESGITPFGVTTFRNREKVFGIKTDDRRRHVYVIGKTGMGKTTLIENMVYGDIIAGKGVCYVDPHGDTAEKMLEWIPTSRINDVIYFNPADLDFPISFNVLEKVESEHRHLISSGLIGVFKKLWADSWGPRLEYILRNAILALLEYPDSTLLGINRMLVDKDYRLKVVSKITDPVVRSFWVDEFPRWNERVLQEVISPIQNKVGQFLSTALIRNVVGQVKSSINLRKVMDEGKILIMNLSKGRIGEDASHLLGAMMITKIQLAAMSRVNIPEDDRNDFYLYVDEFQNFISESFADILSEARKYHLNLIMAHQYIEQLGEVVKPAVFGNVGTLICFRVGAEDAEFLEKEFAPYLYQQDLVNLPKYHIYLKLMIDGVASEPFSAKGMPPVYSESMGNEAKVINVSRERYAKTREIVEDKIKRWSETKQQQISAAKFEKDQQKKADYQAKKAAEARGETFDKTRTKFDDKDQSKNFNQVTTQSKPENQNLDDNRNKKKKKKDKKPGYSAVCYGCKKETEVPFKPDGVRPVFCQDCLKKSRRGQIPVLPDEAADTKPKNEESISLSQLNNQTVDFKGKAVTTNEQKEPVAMRHEGPSPHPTEFLARVAPVKPSTSVKDSFGRQQQSQPKKDKKQESEQIKQEQPEKEAVTEQESKLQPANIRRQSPNQEPIKKEVSKQEMPRQEFSKQEQPKQAHSRQEPPKQVQPKQEEPVVEEKTQARSDLPAADFLADQNNVNEGDVVEL